MRHFSAHQMLHIGGAAISVKVAGTFDSPVARCFLGFNPSRAITSSGIGLCPPRDAIAAVEKVLDHPALRNRVVTETQDIEVRRIDVARNLYAVSDPSRYLLGLFSLPRKWCRELNLYGGVHGIPETLRAGSKAGGYANLYDKHSEHPLEASPGTLRFEVQARGWGPRYGEIHTVGDISDLSTHRLMRQIANWFGLESQLVNTDTAIDLILASDLKSRTQLGLLKYVRARMCGRRPEGSKATIAKYDNLLRDLKIAPVLEGSATPSIFRLDLKSGTEVQVA